MNISLIFLKNIMVAQSSSPSSSLILLTSSSLVYLLLPLLNGKTVLVVKPFRSSGSISYGIDKCSILKLYARLYIRGVSVMAKTDLKPTPNLPIGRPSFFVLLPTPVIDIMSLSVKSFEPL